MTRAAAASAIWTDVALVNSRSDPDTDWLVQTNNHGQWRCYCKKFIFSRQRPKMCHHIEEVLRQQVGRSLAAIAMTPEVTPSSTVLAQAAALVDEMLTAAMVAVQPHKKTLMAAIAARYLEPAPVVAVDVDRGVRRITLEDE